MCLLAICNFWRKVYSALLLFFFFLVGLSLLLSCKNYLLYSAYKSDIKCGHNDLWNIQVEQ